LIRQEKSFLCTKRQAPSTKTVGLDVKLPCDWPRNLTFAHQNLTPLPADQSPIARGLAGEDFVAQVFSLMDSDGETKYVSVSSSQVVPRTAAIQFVLVIDDISQSEKQRLQIERSSRLDALGQLTGGIAHDFNNILTAILYSIVLAGRTDDPKLRAEHLKEAEKSVGRAKLQTSRLMTFAGRQPGLAETKSVAEVFRSFESLVRPILEASFEFAVDDVDADVSVLCDAPQLESTLMNLVLNSRDAMIAAGRGDKISLMARVVDAAPEVSLGQTDRSEMGGYVEISVADNGPGMDHETQRRAADPFFTTKEEGSGKCLKVSAVRAVARGLALRWPIRFPVNPMGFSRSIRNWMSARPCS
jgi:signal transduction histidine kinase